MALFKNFTQKFNQTLIGDHICLDCTLKRAPHRNFVIAAWLGAATFGSFIGFFRYTEVVNPKIEELREKVMALNISMSGVQVFADSKEWHK